MAIGQTYCLHEKMVLVCEEHSLSFRALRLLHGLMFVLDELSGRNGMRLIQIAQRPREIAAATIASAVGPRGARDHRGLRRAMSELHATGLTTRLELDPTGRVLTFALDPHIAKLSMLYKKDRFAILDTDRIAECGNAQDILFYTRAAMLERADWPMFEIPQLKGAAPSHGWRTSSRLWLASAERFSRLLGHSYLVLPQTPPFSSQIVGVRVKITHANTSWTPGKLYSIRGSAQPYAIVDGRRRCLTHAECERRRKWSRVEGP
jgi:hypothetical protein